jgi:hypothetical protein
MIPPNQQVGGRSSLTKTMVLHRQIEGVIDASYDIEVS